MCYPILEFFSQNDLVIKSVLKFNFRLNENMEFPDLSGDDIEWLQEAFVKTICKRVEESSHRQRRPRERPQKVVFGTVYGNPSGIRS